ncbi:MAG: DUF2339 domain-containing protein [Novosphingobium sp.]|nr:DUF2339 domain-containing protein [Novosphingobium sp.]
MKLWGAVAGALAGWLLGGIDAFGAALGAIVGLGLGAWLGREVRGLVREATANEAGSFAHPPPAPSEAPTGVSLARQMAATPPLPPAAASHAPLPAQHSAPSEPEPAPPAAPDPVERIVAAAREWLLGGNTIVRVGLVVLFIGLAFLARFAATAGLFPLEARLALVALAGAALLGVGFNRRVERPAFGLALQGAGVAVLYLTAFAAARVYELMPLSLAFAAMIAFCALGCALALLQDARGLALGAFAGGFAVPFVLGGESPTPLVPFAYYTLLNAAILVIAWRRSWRSLNLLGFFATFAGASVWGVTSYAPQHFLVCQVFLAISVAIYLAMAVLYAHNTPGRLGNAADATLLFGTGIAGFGLEAALVADRPYASAGAALAFAAIYLATAAWTWSGRRPEWRTLSESLAAIGIGFATLAVPLAFEVEWTSAAWALEGAGAVWVGARQGRWGLRAFGLALIAVAALIVLALLRPNVAALPILNTAFVQTVFVAAPLIAAAWWLRAPLPPGDSASARWWQPFEREVAAPLFLAGFGFACLALGLEVTRLRPGGATPVLAGELHPVLLAAAFLAAMWVGAWAARRHGWAVAGWPARASLLVAALALMTTLALDEHVLAWPGVLGWLAVVALHFDLLRRGDALAATTAAASWRYAMHAGTLWLTLALAADGLDLMLERLELWDTAWAGAAFLASGSAALLGLSRWPVSAMRWPLAPHGRAWWWSGAAPLAALIAFAAFTAALFAEGVAPPLPYVPLLNPVDLTVAGAGLALALWRRRIVAAEPKTAAMAGVAGSSALVAGAALFFAALNGAWLRTAHHWLGIAWDGDALTASPAVQTGLAILWTVTALVLMLFAARRALRAVWLAGAALLGLTVAKLVLVDLSSAESWQRIVTFIAVGVLMLVIGYFAPLPPRNGEADAGPA